jgi:hypothetical protein
MNSSQRQYSFYRVQAKKRLSGDEISSLLAEAAQEYPFDL